MTANVTDQATTRLRTAARPITIVEQVVDALARAFYITAMHGAEIDA